MRVGTLPTYHPRKEGANKKLRLRPLKKSLRIAYGIVTVSGLTVRAPGWSDRPLASPAVVTFIVTGVPVLGVVFALSVTV